MYQVSFGQAKIQFIDSTFYQENDSIENFPESDRQLIKQHTFHFKNIGDSDLVFDINTAYANNKNWHISKKRVNPGEIGLMTITTHYRFDNGEIYIKCNAVNKSTVYWQYKVVPIRHQSICKYPQKIRIGKLKYFDTDTIRFAIKNTGQHALAIRFIDNIYREIDVIMFRLILDSVQSGFNYNQVSSSGWFGSLKPSDSVKVELVVQNIFGNIGHWYRTIPFVINDKDTFGVKLTGRFIGKPFRKKLAFLATGNNPQTFQLIYNHNKLINKEIWGNYPITMYYSDCLKAKTPYLQVKMFFEGSEVKYIKTYNGDKSNQELYREDFFENEKLIKTFLFNKSKPIQYYPK